MKLKHTLMALAALTATASAASISINFQGNGASSVTAAAGVESSTVWNTGSTGSGTLNDLTADNGATTTDVTWSSHTTWSNGASSAGNGEVNQGYLDDNGPTGMNVTVSDIAYANYTVHVFFNNDFGAGTVGLFDIDVNGSTEVTTGAFANDNTVFDAGNTITVTGLTSSTLTLASGNRTNPGISNITGIQIVQAVPEPSSTALLGLGGLALILRRRK